MCPPVSEAHLPDLRAQCVREGSLSLTHTGARSGPKSCHCRSEYRSSSERYCRRVVREIKTNLRRANRERRMEALRARRTAGQEGAARMKETARGLQGSGEQRRAPSSRPLSASHRHVRPASPGGSAPAPGLPPLCALPVGTGDQAVSYWSTWRWGHQAPVLLWLLRLTASAVAV